MATAPASIPIEQYLETSYSPDREYLDGWIVERNVGQGEHSYTQGKLFKKLDDAAERSGALALVEQRTRVALGRVRVPDISVVKRLERVTTVPPLLCLEILSPDDRWSRVTAAVADYQSMGVPRVWIIDPFSRRAWIFSDDQPPTEILDGILRAPEIGIDIPLSSVLPPAE